MTSRRASVLLRGWRSPQRLWSPVRLQSLHYVHCTCEACVCECRLSAPPHTGVNMPDHAILFSQLKQVLCKETEAYVVLLKSTEHCTGTAGYPFLGGWDTPLPPPPPPPEHLPSRPHIFLPSHPRVSTPTCSPSHTCTHIYTSASVRLHFLCLCAPPTSPNAMDMFVEVQLTMLKLQGCRSILALYLCFTH